MLLDFSSDRCADGGDEMGLLKLILSFVAIAACEYSMRGNKVWNSDARIGYTFEIAASILCAGWIAHAGW